MVYEAEWPDRRPASSRPSAVRRVAACAVVGRPPLPEDDLEPLIILGEMLGQKLAEEALAALLSSGERQRFTPAQDMSQPLGKVLHLTLDGRPAAGNPFAGQQGATSVTITNPPADTEAAKTATGRTFTWPGANTSQIM